jgi:hypothetical protein
LQAIFTQRLFQKEWRQTHLDAWAAYRPVFKKGKKSHKEPGPVFPLLGYEK